MSRQPEESNDKDRPMRYIQPTIELAKYLLTHKEAMPAITLKRPPVVLVHGLWGCGDRRGCGINNEVKNSWKEFEDNFNKNSLYDITLVNYYQTNADSFAMNAKFIRSRGIDLAIGMEANNQFAATKVDLIGNSMGGILPRVYCKDNAEECQNHIRKFITVDTPHLGSELAEKLIYIQSLSNIQPLPWCYKILEEVNSAGKTIWENPSDAPPYRVLKGALIDLAVDSPALSSINGSNSIVPYKAIIGSTSSDVLPYYAYDIDLHEMWFGLNLYCGYKPDFVFLEDNDRIVSVSSQQGFSVGQYHIFGVDHLTVLGDPKTATKIQEWLEKP